MKEINDVMMLAVVMLTIYGLIVVMELTIKLGGQ